MGGNVKFEDALAARLALIEPSRESIEKCIKGKPFQLTPGVKELIEALHEKDVSVWFVSGGFRIMIEVRARGGKGRSEAKAVSLAPKYLTSIRSCARFAPTSPALPPLSPLPQPVTSPSLTSSRTPSSSRPTPPEPTPGSMPPSPPPPTWASPRLSPASRRREASKL